MTYSRHQLQFRFIRGILLGLVIGAVVVFFARPFLDSLPFIGRDASSKEKLTKAGKQAKELRDKAAKGSTNITEDDLKSIAAGEAEEAKQVDTSTDPDRKANEEGGTEADPANDSKEDGSEETQLNEDDGTSPPASGPRRVYEDTRAGFSVTLPSGWISDATGGQVQLKPENAAPSSGGDDTPAGLLVRTRAKATSASLREVYNGKTAPNYYTDASNGVVDGTVDGRPSVTFKGVAGFESTTVTVVDLGDTIIEIHDQGERRQSDGTFAQVVSSFRAR